VRQAKHGNTIIRYMLWMLDGKVYKTVSKNIKYLMILDNTKVYLNAFQCQVITAYCLFLYSQSRFETNSISIFSRWKLIQFSPHKYMFRRSGYKFWISEMKNLLVNKIDSFKINKFHSSEICHKCFSHSLMVTDLGTCSCTSRTILKTTLTALKS